MARDEYLAGPDHNLSEIITLADLGLGLMDRSFLQNNIENIFQNIFQKLFSIFSQKLTRKIWWIKILYLPLHQQTK